MLVLKEIRPVLNSKFVTILLMAIASQQSVTEDHRDNARNWRPKQEYTTLKPVPSNGLQRVPPSSHASPSGSASRANTNSWAALPQD
jgi:hypothetical protein